MTWIHSAGWVLGVAGLFAAPRVAHAITVECSNAYGACEVSNEPASFATCSCDGGASDVAGGGDDWDGFSEAELLEICNDHLELCGEPLGSTTGGSTDAGSADSGWSTDTGSATDTGQDDVGTADTGADAGSGDDVGTLSGGDAGGSNGGSTEGDSGGTTSGGADATDSDGPGSSGDSSESSTGQAEGDGPISAGDADGSSSDAAAATEDPGADDSAAGKGCSCSADGPLNRRGAVLLAGLFGLAGWRRRSFVR